MPAKQAYTACSDTCIIIPAYNPSVELVDICRALLQKKLQVVVVDDGSGNQVAFRQLAPLPVTIVQHPVNLGQGAALETGIRKALETDKRYFVTFDADGQHMPDTVDALLMTLVQEQADIVFGSRFYDKQNSRHVPPFKRATLKLGALFEGLFTGVRLTDAHNGLRAFTRTVAENIHFTENRMAHATEILWLTRKYQWRYRECPVQINYNRASQHPSRSIEIAIDLFLRKFIS